MKYAVIDIGSNSVRLMRDGTKSVNPKLLHTTQLAKNMVNDVLQQCRIADTASAVKEFADLAESEGYEVLIFATEAVRSAKNGKDLTNIIFAQTGIKVDIIDGDTEATLGFLGACGSFGNKSIIDIGGASSELAAGMDGKLYYSKSLPFGAVRLKDRFGDDLLALQKFLKEQVCAYDKVRCDEYIAISGTATSLSAMRQNMRVYEPTKIHGSSLPAEFLEEIISALYKKSAVDIAAQYPVIGIKRAEVILCGAAVLLEVAKYLEIKGFTVSDRDNAEGYLIYKQKINA